MMHIFPAKTIVSLLLAFLSMYSFAIIPSGSSTKVEENLTRSLTKLGADLSTSVSISITNEERVSADFTVFLRINREDYAFFYLDGFSRALDTIGSRDYARFFDKLDRSWYGIDIWDEGVSDKLGVSLTDSLRDFVLTLRDFESNPTETIHLSETTDDDVTLDISVDFDSDYSEPDEYTDFSDFVL